MHKKIVNELVSNNQYFTEQSPLNVSRAVGINEHYFMVDDNLIGGRQNIWYFSNDFEKILIDYINNKKSVSINETTYSKEIIDKYVDWWEIRTIFFEYKDKLKDLAWIIKGYG